MLVLYSYTYKMSLCIYSIITHSSLYIRLVHLLCDLYYMQMSPWMESQNIKLIFFNLVERLFSCDDVMPFKESCNLLACNNPQIQLFSEEYLLKLSHCELNHLKLLLFPHMTWLDNSLLKELIESSKNQEAKNLLNEFCLSIDYTLPIKSFPIPTPSQLIIPLDDSDHALITTKCDCGIAEAKLLYVIDVKKELMQKFGITEHALQLTAISEEQNVIYWMVPKCVTSIIEEKLTQTHIILDNQPNSLLTRIIRITVLPSVCSLDINDEKLSKFGPLYFFDAPNSYVSTHEFHVQ